MLSKKKRKRLLEEKKFFDEIDKEDLEDRKIAIAAMGNLYGFTEQESEDYFNLIDKENNCEVTGKLREALSKINGNYKKTLDNLEHAITKYESWLDELYKSPLVKRVLEKGLDYDSVESVLRKAGAKIKIDDNINPDDGIYCWDLTGWFYLDNKVVDICSKLEEFDPIKKLSDARTLEKTLRAVFNEGGVAVTKRYVEDFVAELEDLKVFFFLDPSDAVRTVAHNYLHGEVEATPVLERIERIRDSYLKLAEPFCVDILNLFPLEGIHRFELVQLVSERLEKLKDESADLRVVYELVGDTNAEQRLELLDYISDSPHVISLYKQLKKGGVIRASYTQFLLSNSDLRLAATAEQKTLLETIVEISNINSQLTAATTLLEHGTEFVFKQEAGTIVQIAKKYNLAHIVLNDYFAAIESEQPNKAAIALKLGIFGPEALKLKSLRQHLRGIPDEELAWINENPTYRELEKRILGYNKAAEAKPEEKEKKIEIPWYDLLVTSLKAQGASAATLQLVDDAYRNLPSSLAYKLRNIWKTQSDTLEEFCRGVNELNKTEIFQLLLESPLLFGAYKNRLKEGDIDFQNKLRDRARSKSNNVYRDIWEILVPASKYESPPKLEIVPDAEELDIKKGYKRIVIWGGQYDPGSKTRIRTEIEMPVEIFDIFTRKRDISALRQDDAVICVTTSMNHPLYYSIKRFCKGSNIDFYHFDRAGYKPLIEFLQKKIA